MKAERRTMKHETTDDDDEHDEPFNPIRQASGRRLSAAASRRLGRERIVHRDSDAVAPRPERQAA